MLIGLWTIIRVGESIRTDSRDYSHLITDFFPLIVFQTTLEFIESLLKPPASAGVPAEPLLLPDSVVETWKGNA